MANGATNADLKSKNEKIFRTIEKRLNSYDEAAFVRAADKLRIFISRRQAYYPEARPLIVRICKGARATLTLLAKSGSPFNCSDQVPAELRSRAVAYSHLIQTVLQHANAFEPDHYLKGDLKELFFSITDKPSQDVAKSTQESRGETSLSGLQTFVLPETSLRQHTLPPIETSLVHPSAANSQRALSSELLTQSPRSASAGDKALLEPLPRASATEDNSLPRSPKQSTPSPPGSPQPQSIYPYLSVNDSPTDPPITPISPAMVVKNATEEVSHPGKPTARKSTSKLKSKLNKRTKLPQSLINADGQARAMKQRQSLEPLTPTGSPSVGSSVLGDSALLIKKVKASPNLNSPVKSEADVAMNTDTPANNVGSSNFETHELAKPFTFVCIDYGCNAGKTLSLRYELTPEQREALLLWRNRDEHEWDVSSGLCLSLVCYRMPGARARFHADSAASALLGTPPSWPTNARLSADIGSFRVFLAPPLQVTHENFVDISQQIDESQVEVRLDHGGDMGEYVFALILHHPTPSQLHELGEERTKRRNFCSTLAGLRITAIDVFG